MEICLYNTVIWTEAKKYSWMKIDSGKITEMGTDKPEPTGKSFDMNGKFIFPGLIESHIHVYGIGLHDIRLKLDKPKSIAEMQNKLGEYSMENPDLSWIVGYNWDQDYMEDNRYPDKTDLDLIIPDRPVALYRGCHHIMLLNSKALELTGITKQTIPPEGGQIDLDDNGDPTGILREKAMSIFTSTVDLVNPSQQKRAIEIGLKKCLENGITSVQTNDRASWNIYKNLQNSNKLPIRVSLTMYHDEIDNENSVQPGAGNDMFQWDRIKIVADGSLGAQTAALRAPYDDTGQIGLPIYSQEELVEIIRKATDKGFRIETHAIGDQAAESVLNAYEIVGNQDRPVLTHCQVLGKDLVEKMRKLGVIANIQPQFVRTDSQWVEKRLGRSSERYRYSYAWKTLIDNQITVAGGSDAPIEEPDPLDGIFQSIFRYNPRNEVWRAEECLSFIQAMRIYTKGGAFAMKAENRLGELKPGFYADFIVLDTDIERYPEKIPQTKILEVWVNGQKSYVNSLTSA